MSDFKWPRINDNAVRLLPPDHPNIVRVLSQILDHARAGRTALLANKFVEAKFHRDCCELFLWRLGVDGLTANDEVRWDGAKYETRLPGRLSSAAARELRESKEFARRKQSALENRVACDHVAPRSCVADVLVRPDWWDSDDEDGGRRFLLAHGEVAIIALHEDNQLDDEGLKSDMPSEWWSAKLADKARLIRLRYEKAGIIVSRWPEPVPARENA